MNIDQKMTLLLAVEDSGFSVSEACKRLEIPRSTYYRWKANLRKEGPLGLEDRKSSPKNQWNALTPNEEEIILKIASEEPELSSREISYKITDTESFSVSESTVYRILKKAGLIVDSTIERVPAAKEYHTKPQEVNEQWQTDATYLHVEGWGWFYLISVLDDFSRKILSWDILDTMTGDDFVGVIEDACRFSNLSKHNMPNLVSDRGPALVSEALGDYLSDKGIHHILARPYHPQTNGKIERYHKSLKKVVKLHIYDRPIELREEVRKFIDHYNTSRYHESLGNVTPNDVYYGRRDEIIKERDEKRRLTFMRRKQYNCSHQKVMMH